MPQGENSADLTPTVFRTFLIRSIRRRLSTMYFGHSKRGCFVVNGHGMTARGIPKQKQEEKLTKNQNLRRCPVKSEEGGTSAQMVTSVKNTEDYILL